MRMRRVYAEITVKVRIFYESPATLQLAIESIQDDFAGQNITSPRFSWESLSSKRPAVRVLE